MLARKRADAASTPPMLDDLLHYVSSKFGYIYYESAHLAVLHVERFMFVKFLNKIMYGEIIVLLHKLVICNGYSLYLLLSSYPFLQPKKTQHRRAKS